MPLRRSEEGEAFSRATPLACLPLKRCAVSSSGRGKARAPFSGRGGWRKAPKELCRGKGGSGRVSYAVIVEVCSDSSPHVTPPRRDAAMRTILRQAFTSRTASGVSAARAWTRTAQVPSDSRINTTRGKESRRTLFVWQS